MAAATAGYDWVRTPRSRAPSDSPSPLYPDRPIRPLPKRRLRSRLSPEQADSIVFPPAPDSSNGPLFSFPYSQVDKGTTMSRPARKDHSHTCSCGAEHSDIESEGSEEPHAGVQQSPSLLQYTRNLLGGKGPPPASAAANAAVAAFSNPPIPESAGSSVDGYESFENTNNKKKRKIPVSVTQGAHHHSSLSADLSNLGISGRGGENGEETGSERTAQYYGSGSSAVPAASSGTGISGAGRGRFGRGATRNNAERRPLAATSTNGNTSFAAAHSERGGIISEAIDRAQQQAPATPQKGNENISLLHQQANKSGPQKGQFTFTCDSDLSDDTSGGVKFPRNPFSAPKHGMPPDPVTHHPQPHAPPAQHQATQTQPPPEKPRRRRRTARESYALAARNREMQQRDHNARNPPTKDTIWICHFCEYEDIFGEKPEALIRSYEKRDRKLRKAEAERQRLLEKAKMKGRNKKKKASKGDKNSAAHTHASQGQTHPHPDDYHPDDNLDQLDGAHDYYEDEYGDEEYDPAPVGGRYAHSHSSAGPPPPTHHLPEGRRAVT